MKDNKALILAAGLGLRMGIEGRELPKILWPIFEKTLLELQILWLRDLGAERFYINTHHCHERIEKFVKDKNIEIEILHEDVLLGSGGCLHNFKRRIGDERVLVSNGDQFYLSEDRAPFSQSKSPTLYCLETQENYNELIVDNGLLKEIREKKEKNVSRLTFSGLSVIDLQEMPLVPGVSQFFESVADFKRKNVYVQKGHCTLYYDFGTLERYRLCLKKILQQCLPGEEKDPFVAFLLKHRAISPEKINPSKMSYDSFHPREISLEGLKIKIPL